MISKLEYNCQITLTELATHVFNQFGIRISTSTVARHLENRLYTVKKTTEVPVGANNDANKAQRRDYVQSILNFTTQNKILFYQDESNINLFCRASRGRARRGQRARTLLPNSRGQNIHCIALYSSMHAVAYFERKRGSFKKDTCVNWFVRALTHLRDFHQLNLGDVVVILDNAPCHSQLETNFPPEHELGQVTFLRSAPYSAPLSPIEFYWNTFKIK